MFDSSAFTFSLRSDGLNSHLLLMIGYSIICNLQMVEVLPQLNTVHVINQCHTCPLSKNIKYLIELEICLETDNQASYVIFLSHVIFLGELCQIWYWYS